MNRAAFHSVLFRCYGVSHNDNTHKDTSLNDVTHNDVTHNVISHNATLVMRDVNHNDVSHNNNRAAMLVIMIKWHFQYYLNYEPANHIHTKISHFTILDK